MTEEQFFADFDCGERVAERIEKAWWRPALQVASGDQETIDAFARFFKMVERHQIEAEPRH